MAIQNTLAQEIVEIVTKGVVEAAIEIDRLGLKFGGMTGQARQAKAAAGSFAGGLMSALRGPSQMFFGLSTSLRMVRRGFQGLAAISGRIAFGGAFGLGAIIHTAAKGTVEGDRLSQAWERFARVIGDGVAPYIRILTAALMGATEWFRGLSNETKDSITQWALVGTAIAAIVAMIPLLVGGLASIAFAFAILTSPITLVIAGIVAISIAAARMFDYFQSGGADAADSLNQSNETWLGSLVKGIGFVTVAISKMFNWVATQAAKVSDWIADVMAQAAEMLGIVPEGTVKELRKMDPIQAPQIDVQGMEDFFAKVKRGADRAVVGFGDLIDHLKQAGALMGQLKGQEMGGFNRKMEVRLETPSGTWERLTKSLAESTAANDDKQLRVAEQMRDWLGEAVGKLQKLIDMGPVVK